jgi:hypothetical protein
MVTTRGLGHRRILRDPTMLSIVTEFITTPGRAAAASEWSSVLPSTHAKAAAPRANTSAMSPSR